MVSLTRLRSLWSEASKTHTPRPSGFGASSRLSIASWGSARWTMTEPKRRSRLARVEVERLVAEQDVVRPARGGEPCGGLLPRLLAGGGLARVHVRRLVPAPRELDAEECGEADEDDGRLRPPRQTGQLEEAGGDEHLEERQGKDKVPALEEDARLRPGDHERERRDEQHRAGQEHCGGARAEEDDSAEHGERGDDGGRRGPAGAEVADRVPDVLEDVDRRSKLRVALAGEADPEARREHAIDEPERRDEHDDDPERDRGGPERKLAPPPARQDINSLRGEHEGPVRLRRDGEHHRRDPRGPAPRGPACRRRGEA